ncbi:hypothetical protein SALBM217S_07859 [Streptomyces griseoloalbus]
MRSAKRAERPSESRVKWRFSTEGAEGWSNSYRLRPQVSAEVRPNWREKSGSAATICMSGSMWAV